MGGNDDIRIFDDEVIVWTEVEFESLRRLELLRSKDGSGVGVSYNSEDYCPFII